MQEDIESKVRAAKEKQLKELQRKQAEHQKTEWERRLATKYHKVRFFERVKLERGIQKVKRQIGRQQQQPPSSQDQQLAEQQQQQLEQLQSMLQQLEQDLLYVLHFPKGERYVSLFKQGETPEAQAKIEAERARLRAFATKQLQERAALTEADEGAALAAKGISAAAAEAQQEPGLNGAAGAAGNAKLNQQNAQKDKQHKQSMQQLQQHKISVLDDDFFLQDNNDGAAGSDDGASGNGGLVSAAASDDAGQGYHGGHAQQKQQPSQQSPQQQHSAKQKKQKQLQQPASTLQAQPIRQQQQQQQIDRQKEQNRPTLAVIGSAAGEVSMLTDSDNSADSNEGNLEGSNMDISSWLERERKKAAQRSLAIDAASQQQHNRQSQQQHKNQHTDPPPVKRFKQDGKQRPAAGAEACHSVQAANGAISASSRHMPGQQGSVSQHYNQPHRGMQQRHNMQKPPRPQLTQGGFAPVKHGISIGKGCTGFAGIKPAPGHKQQLQKQPLRKRAEGGRKRRPKRIEGG
eukprot:GHRR01013236.1.p1 GENE.GHRR01013236.1~~GHRR01013236.1.p1  ORF type:complete len:517 (+),score=236.80 GHRR01013236.1:1440-2990(+)